MIERVVIISGASKGLGLALAQHLAQAQTLIIGIARSNSIPLVQHIEQQQAHYQFIPADLAQTSGCEQACTALQSILYEHRHARSFWLINNAGTVAPMAQSHQLTQVNAISQALQLNLSSLISLSACFLAHSPVQADRRILNISSGAGRSPVAGWAVYGSSKAAVDFYTQTLALEHPTLRAVALAPGVINTDMQAQIRATDPQHFPNLDRFLQLHQHQQLASAEHTAQHIASYLASDDFGQQTLDDIRHYF